MPIRINLLAEAQAAEELRRRDPVKRGLWIGALLISAALAWASMLQTRIALQKAQVTRLENRIGELKSEYDNLVQSQKTLAETRQKLAALARLNTNRYLSGNLLDALQRAYVPDVKVIKLKTSFNYSMAPATPPKTNAFTVIQGKPATATERITVHIEAIDSSSNPGDQVNDYKEAVASLKHLDEVFQKSERDVRLTGLNPPQADFSGRQFVLFTLECNYPEKVR
jgi:Tfp pilus assembly protein PilN